MHDLEIIAKLYIKTEKGEIKWSIKPRSNPMPQEYPIYVTKLSDTDNIELSEFTYADSKVIGVTWVGLRLVFVNKDKYPFKVITGERDTKTYDQLEKLHDLISLKLNDFDKKITDLLGEPNQEELDEEDWKILKALGLSDSDIEDIKNGKK